MSFIYGCENSPNALASLNIKHLLLSISPIKLPYEIPIWWIHVAHEALLLTAQLLQMANCIAIVFLNHKQAWILMQCYYHNKPKYVTTKLNMSQRYIYIYKLNKKKKLRLHLQWKAPSMKTSSKEASCLSLNLKMYPGKCHSTNTSELHTGVNNR